MAIVFPDANDLQVVTTRARWLTPLLLLLFLSACNQPPPGPVDVGGSLLDADGQPLARIALRFHPLEKATPPRPTLTCFTQTNGEFVGRCWPGTYRVTVLGAPGKKVVMPPGIPSECAAVDTTPWEIKVPRGGTKKIVLRVE